MVSHKRLSPGVEVNEIDRSAYDTTDYSITDTATFICGFADEGEDYVPTWINSMDTFRKRYGVPRNEMELYFKYAAQEIIGRGGTVVAAKLPYCNQKKDSFNAVRYTLGNLSAFSDDDVYGRRFSEIDATLTSMLTINSDVQPFRMTLDCFDKYRTNKMMFDRDTFVVVDITKGDYGSVYDEEDRECLGIIPVVATAGNAAFFQLMAGLSGDRWISDGDPSGLGEYQTPDLSAFQPLSEVRSCLSAGLFPPESMQRDLSLGFKFSDIKDGQRNFILSASSVNVESVSKTAAAEFPSLLQLAEDRLDRQYLKHICVAVFQAVKSQSDDSVEIRLIESFAGSLDKTSKSEETGASDYICDVVNGRSRFINVFANVDAKNGKYSKAQMLMVKGQTAVSLGFCRTERAKKVKYVESVVDPLTRIFDMACDPNQVPIDVVCDAGVTNIAAFAKLMDAGNETENAHIYPLVGFGGQEQAMEFEGTGAAQRAWYSVFKKYEEFCSGTRRDCLFAGDIFRPFALDGNEKVIRGTNAAATVENTLVPRIRRLPAPNSSWAAGYSDWFYAQVPDTGDFFWCPPSIKAAGVMAYCDAYFHTWSAPAGHTRGVVPGIYDLAFSPRNDEAGRIYQKAWNYAVSYPIDGIIMEGQKTFQIKPTALDRINVRRLMIWLEKRVTAAARRFLYEGNTPYMRQRFLDFIDPIFQEAKSGDGILDYAVRCDDTLNTPDVIDRNELRCIIAVKPVKTIEWIVVNLICTNQSASVTEEVMR